MTKQDKNLGEFEQIILLAILRQNNKSYGAQISDTIETFGNRSINFGALYTTLSRLEKKGLVSSQIGEATAVRGGRAKKYFTVSAEGQKAVKNSVNTLLSMVDGLDLSSI